MAFSVNFEKLDLSLECCVWEAMCGGGGKKIHWTSFWSDLEDQNLLIVNIMTRLVISVSPRPQR